MPGPKDIDYEYMAKIEQYRPVGAYYEHSTGDKLLYMQKVDRIDYDLVEAHRLRKEKQLEEELQKLKDERDANKLVERWSNTLTVLWRSLIYHKIKLKHSLN